MSLLLCLFVFLVFNLMMMKEANEIAKGYGAKPPVKPIPELTLPVAIVIVTQTGGESCNTQVTNLN